MCGNVTIPGRCICSVSLTRTVARFRRFFQLQTRAVVPSSISVEHKFCAGGTSVEKTTIWAKCSSSVLHAWWAFVSARRCADQIHLFGHLVFGHKLTGLFLSRDVHFDLRGHTKRSLEDWNVFPHVTARA